jgi:hypothetical protein
MLITPEMVMAAGPCSDWTEERVRAVLGDGMTPREIAELEEVYLADRAWALWSCLPKAVTYPCSMLCVTRSLDLPAVVEYAGQNAEYAAWRSAWLDESNCDSAAARAAGYAARAAGCAVQAAGYAVHAAADDVQAAVRELEKSR